jgi:alpha-L-fucosidase
MNRNKNDWRIDLMASQPALKSALGALAAAGLFLSAACASSATKTSAPVAAASPGQAVAPDVPGGPGNPGNPGGPNPRAMGGGMGFGMGPTVTAEQVQAAVEMAKTPKIAGPVKPTWDSLKANYQIPEWMLDGKLGIFMHFGLYSVPAYHNEWYEKHMYGNEGIRQWHIEHWGPLDKFGYKDFIPKFTLPKFNADEWAKIFKASGAKWAMPTAEHHDGYSLWDSKTNPFNSVKTGPHRDIIGELAKATRAQGLRFGVTNHNIEHYTFIETSKFPEGMKTDLDAPGYEDFYWTKHNDERLKLFLANWVKKNIELIDQYHPDILWYDNGLNARAYDPLKLDVAAYYYNRARQWGKDVTLNAKSDCFLSGMIRDYEKTLRAPTTLTDVPWTVDDPIGSTWGYTEGETVRSPKDVVATLVEVVSKNGILLLNLSPKGDGSIPENQQKTLFALGDWLKINGDAIYGTRPWTQYGEGNLQRTRKQAYTGKDIRFTTKKGALYAILMAWPESGEAVITSLPAGAATGKSSKVTMLGGKGKLAFTQDAEGLTVKLPATKPCDFAFCLKIEGLKLK